MTKNPKNGGDWSEVSAARPCPRCGKATWCSVARDSGATICRRVDDGTGEHRVDDGGCDFWLYTVNGNGKTAEPPCDVAGPTAVRASDPDLDRVYGALLKALSLDQRHRANLKQRGLEDGEIDAAGYRTVPAKGRRAIANRLVEQFGDQLVRSIPGIYVKRDGTSRWWSIAGAAGMLIPCRNVEGQIIALKVRADHAKPGQRYTYVSSRKYGGPGPGAQVHVPILAHTPGPAVRFTEGELKADVATARSGMLTVSAPGVSAWRRVIPVLKTLGAATVRLAFDADRETNPNVERALRAAANQLVAEGFAVMIESWPIEHGKGIDDVFAAGHAPSVTPWVNKTETKPNDAPASPSRIEDELAQLRRADGEDWGTLLDRLEAGGTIRALALAAGKRRGCFAIAANALNLSKLEKQDLRDAVRATTAALREEAKESENRDPKPTQADFLVEIGKEAELFHDDAGDAFGLILVDGHREVHALRSDAFKQWLTREYYTRHRKACSDTPLSDAIRVLNARARFEGASRLVHLRVHREGDVCWYDLADPKWRAIRIDKDGWTIEATPAVLFRRHANTKSQVEPTRGGDLQALRRFLHVKSARDWQLLLTWLIAALIPGSPRCILALTGEQGTAKTTTAKMLRRLVDPGKAETIRLPRKPDEFAQAVAHSWLTVFDNLSRISDDHSDAICSAVSGDGFMKRVLYTDEDDKIWEFRRIFLMTGIASFLERPDALDRALLVRLQPFAVGEVKDEIQLWAEFEAARPAIFGALLDALAGCLRELPAVATPPGFRMADFCRIGVAVERHLCLQAGSFVEAMHGNAEAQVEEVLETNPIAGPLRIFATRRSEWCGTASELLADLNADAGPDVPKQPGWPKTSAQLGTHIVRLAPALRKVGIGIEHGIRTSGGAARLIRIRCTGPATPASQPEFRP